MLHACMHADPKLAGNSLQKSSQSEGFNIAVATIFIRNVNGSSDIADFDHVCNDLIRIILHCYHILN